MNFKDTLAQLLRPILAKCKDAWAKMDGEYNEKDDTFRGAQVREKILESASSFITYTPKWGVDLNFNTNQCINVPNLNIDISVKAVFHPVFCTSGKLRVHSGIVLGNTQGRTLEDWWPKFQKEVPVTLAVSTNPKKPQAILIWSDDLTINDIEDTGSQFKLKCDSVFEDRFTIIPVELSNQSPQVGTKKLILNLEVLSYLDPELLRDLEAAQLKCLQRLAIKDQNENSSTQSDCLPMNAIQPLPSTDSVEQELSVQPCVSTV